MTGTARKDSVPTFVPIPESRDIDAEERFAELARNRDRARLNLPLSDDPQHRERKWTFWRIAGGMLAILLGALFALGAAIYIVFMVVGLNILITSITLIASLGNRR